MNRWSKLFLVALRLAVGWHFLYEGIFKIDSDTGTVNYAIGRYALQAATGRLHQYFDAGPPALAPALARVDAWQDEIVSAFKPRQPLDDAQKVRLAALADKVKMAAAESFRGEREAGAVIDFDWDYVHREVLQLADAPPPERFTALEYLQQSAGPLRGLYRGLVPDIEGLERMSAVDLRRRIDQRYTEILAHFERAEKPFTPEQRKRFEQAREAVKATSVAVIQEEAFQSRLQDYKALRDRVAGDASKLHAPFTRERLDADRKKLDVAATEMLAYVEEPLSELAAQAQAIATVEQLGTGPFRHPSSPSDWIDRVIPVSLTAIGLCLMLGLFTPVAAVAAVGQLLMFYFASPPWPGLPAASVGGHYLYVDRNLIEAVAAMLIATTRSGQWVGLDSLWPLITRWRMRTLRPEPEGVPELVAH